MAIITAIQAAQDKRGVKPNKTAASESSALVGIIVIQVPTMSL
jgi:hypothetical protein